MVIVKIKPVMSLFLTFHNGYQEALDLTPGSSSNIAVNGVNMSPLLAKQRGNEYWAKAFRSNRCSF
jgi:hypothetical protein